MTFKKSKSVGLALKQKCLLITLTSNWTVPVRKMFLMTAGQSAVIETEWVDILWVCRRSQVNVSGGRVVLLMMKENSVSVSLKN